ncbi:MAG: SCO1664 family protein [Acidimicrobiales bacterium]
MRAPERSQAPDPLELLRTGEIEVKGRLPWSSNGTFLVEVGTAGASCPAVYKPGRGERPLWDYPPDLYRREVAVYLVSEALGWGLVPETVLRDGPFGPGSVQRFVAADVDQHYFTLLERPEHHEALKAVCLLDLVVNNGDRKSGHCLLGVDGRIWAIDHGLALHTEPKLRTVIWDFGGGEVPPDLRAAVARLATSPPAKLEALLTTEELAALTTRSEAVAAATTFPTVRSARAFPWPLV